MNWLLPVAAAILSLYVYLVPYRRAAKRRKQHERDLHRRAAETEARLAKKAELRRKAAEKRSKGSREA